MDLPKATRELEFAAILNLQYETQHFGYHPRKLLDLVYNIFFENVSVSLNDLKMFMITEFGDILHPQVIQRQTECILQKLVRQCDKSIDKLEIYLNTNVFPIPDHVVLPEDQIHVKSPCTKENDELLDKEIEDLKQKIIQEKLKRFHLKKKILEQKTVKQHLISLQKEISALLTIASQEGITENVIESFYMDLSQLFQPNVEITNFGSKGA